MNAGRVSWWESLLPGLGHIRRGHGMAGARFLVFALGWVAVLVGRWDRLGSLIARGELGDWGALLLLVLMPVLLVWLAHRSLCHLVHPAPRQGLGTWQLAWRTLRANGRAVWGLSILALFYAAAILAPVLAPYEPKEPGAGPEMAHALLAPGDQVAIFGVGKETEAAHRIQVVGPVAILERGRPVRTRAVRIEDMDVPRRGWARHADTATTVRLGEHDVPMRVESYPLGTDARGRDLLTRILHGGRISLFIGFVAMFVAVTLGVLFGSLAGYFGGWVDNVIMRVVDILLAFPRLLLLLLIVSAYEGAGIFTVIAILGATGWMGVSRLVRAEFLKIKALDYAQAARSLGFGKMRIMFRHLLPNAMAPVIVNATLLVGNTMLVEAALSFLGFGVKPPDPSWGNIISDGQDYLETAWWICTIPGLLIVAAVVCINLVGDALRDALDPKTLG